MSQTQRVTGTATKIYATAGMQHVSYHNTDVVKWDDKQIILNTGGWNTNTTKTRMNQAANQFDLGYQVYQKDFAWYVTFQGETVPFNGTSITLRRCGAYD